MPRLSATDSPGRSPITTIRVSHAHRRADVVAERDAAPGSRSPAARANSAGAVPPPVAVSSPTPCSLSARGESPSARTKPISVSERVIADRSAGSRPRSGRLRYSARSAARLVTATGSPIPTVATRAVKAVDIQRFVHRVPRRRVRGLELQHPRGRQRTSRAAQPDSRLGGRPQRRPHVACRACRSPAAPAGPPAQRSSPTRQRQQR